MIQKFPEILYVTRPLLPTLDRVSSKLQDVWDAQWLTNNGMEHQKLEKMLTASLQVPYLSLFNNGTIALIVACQSLRVSGDVITTPFTFPATPHVLTWNNIRPIFCDIDPVTMTIDADKIESMITPQTTAILGVHVFGNPCDVEQIQEIASRYGLKVIYDGAHAFQAEINGTGIGNFGDITMFSFHATKLFHTLEGGALAVKDERLKERIDLLKNFGIKNEEEVVMPGINGKMNEIQAIVGQLVLEMVDEEKGKRRVLRDTYVRCLQDVEGLSLMEDLPGIKNSFQYFVIRIDREKFGKSRDYVYHELKKYNVVTRKYFYPLCSEYTCYRQLPSSSASNLPVAHKVVEEVLALPFYGRLTPEDVEQICTILKSFRE
jgi:dTDP-4-amino-4,6-dideoxygalactose transaminase